MGWERGTESSEEEGRRRQELGMGKRTRKYRRKQKDEGDKNLGWERGTESSEDNRRKKGTRTWKVGMGKKNRKFRR